MRLIVHGPLRGSENMAIDEAILTLRPKLGLDTLRLYMWKPSAVSIGYAQSVEEAVNLEGVKRRGYDLVRRITGGGALLHAEGLELTYSVVIHENFPGLPRDLFSSSIAIATGLVYGLRNLGLNANVRGTHDSDRAELCYLRGGGSDVLVNGRKISGSAQRRTGKALLQHGTLLLGLDPEAWLDTIKVPPGFKANNFKLRMTTIGWELGRCRLNEVINAVVKGFSEALNVKLVEEGLNEEELKLAEALKRKYESRDWTFQAGKR